VSVVRDDKDLLVIDDDLGKRVELFATMNATIPHPVASDTFTTASRPPLMALRITDLNSRLFAYLDRDDAVALRDWINAALTSGAIR
jgi:hypothetical protein